MAVPKPHPAALEDVTNAEPARTNEAPGGRASATYSRKGRPPKARPPGQGCTENVARDRHCLDAGHNGHLEASLERPKAVTVKAPAGKGRHARRAPPSKQQHDDSAQQAYLARMKQYFVEVWQPACVSG